MDTRAGLRRSHPALDGASRLRFVPLIVAVILAVVAAILPRSALRPLDLVGYAVCHRIPERSFALGGAQLPVCARDTGMFLGALLGMIAGALVLRRRASQFPKRPYVFVLAAFFLAWAFDGFNSYVLLLTRQPLFYMPQNWLRLTTGAFMGVSLSAYVVALLNQALWHDATPESTVSSWGDVLRLVAIAVGIIAVVVLQPDFLYGPLAVLSVLGVIVLLTVVNGLMVIIISKRHGTLERWSQLGVAGAAGLLLSIVEIAGIDLLRVALTGGAGWPL